MPHNIKSCVSSAFYKPIVNERTVFRLLLKLETSKNQGATRKVTLFLLMQLQLECHCKANMSASDDKTQIKASIW